MTEKKMTAEAATALRRPFPQESVGKLPKGGVMLDFVGHAAVTDRLLAVDPEWSWDFAESDPTTGQPSLRHSIDPEKNLWIRLTICGVTRIGVGDGPTAKERIGDALRNAAMRFGVGLDLWAKENLVEFAQQRVDVVAQLQAGATQAEAPARESGPKPLDTRSSLAKAMFAALNEAGIPDNERLTFTSKVIGREITSSKEMTEAEARKVLDRLDAMQDAKGDEDA